MRVSGTDNSSSNYLWFLADPNTSSATYTTDRTAAATTSFRTNVSRAGRRDTLVLDLHQPFLTEHTGFNSFNANYDGTNAAMLYSGGMMTVTTSYTGFTYIPIGDSSGSISVYGYNK